MATVSFRVQSWSLQILSNGTRRLDFDLIPSSRYSVIEQLGRSPSQRCFIADFDAKDTEALIERLSVGGTPPHTRPLSATLYDDLSPANLKVNNGYGEVEFADASLRMSIFPASMDELIRQDSLGRKIFYFELNIDGLMSTTTENNEGGLIGWLWKRNAHDRSESSLPIRGFQAHYYKSEAYAAKVGAPSPVVRDDLAPLARMLDLLVAETKKVNWFAMLLCLLAIAILVSIWLK
jgi:hypothetical protein